jgi:hypothetical protein
MTVLRLYDAVTLRHFGTIGRLDVLENRCRHRDPPHWTQAVADEIGRAAKSGYPGCQEILDATWLSPPIEPEIADLRGILHLQIGLNDGRRPPVAHGGEAEGIYFAEKRGGSFVTDDNGAYDFAKRRLGPGRVLDTVDLLREAVMYGEMHDRQAANIVDLIRDSGRSIRRVHPSTLARGYFQLWVSDGSAAIRPCAGPLA